jgi:hypothetical protein
MDPTDARNSVPELARTRLGAGVSVRARWVALAAFLLSLSGVLSWTPSLFLPPSDLTHDPLTFVLRVGHLALQQYTPNMRGVLPVLGALFTGISLVQMAAALGAWMGRANALSLLRTIAYLKIGLFVAAVLLLGLALFSSVNPRNPPWNFAAATWVASFAFIGAYVLIIRAINRILGDPLDLGSAREEEEEIAD